MYDWLPLYWKVRRSKGCRCVAGYVLGHGDSGEVSSRTDGGIQGGYGVQQASPLSPFMLVTVMDKVFMDCII